MKKSIFQYHNIFPYLKVILIPAMIITSLLFIIGCMQAPPPYNPWEYKTEGISLEIQTDTAINLYGGESHTVKLAVYQLTDNGPFLDLTKSQEGFSQLLKVDKFDPSVVGRDQLIVQPKEKKKVILDRVENTRWVGIVAGYYEPENGVPPHVLVQASLIEKRKTLIRRMFESLGLLPVKDMRSVPPTTVRLMLTSVNMYEMDTKQ